MRCQQFICHLLMPPKSFHVSYNDLFSHSNYIVSPNSNNLLLLALLSTIVHIVMRIFSNHCSNIIIKTSSSLGYYFELKWFNVLKNWKIENYGFKLSTTICMYICPILHSFNVSYQAKNYLWCIRRYVSLASLFGLHFDTPITQAWDQNWPKSTQVFDWEIQSQSNC